MLFCLIATVSTMRRSRSQGVKVIVYCINIKQTLSSAKMIILLVTKIQKVSKLATHHSFMNANIRLH